MIDRKQATARGLLVFAVALVCVVLDQMSKQWALSHLSPGRPQPFIPGFLKLNLTSNPGAAFSLGSQHGQLMGIVAFVLTLLIVGWIIKRVVSNLPLPVVERFGMGCLLGGAIGNLLDRYNLGRVTDFLDFEFMSFPVFNVADSLIDVGIGLVFISMLLVARNDRTNGGATGSDDLALPTSQTQPTE